VFQHAKQDHLYALLKVAKELGVPHVYIHFFGDGRDTDPKSGAGYMESLLDKIREIGIGEIATVVGRYYAMDRDKRWERVEVGLNAMVIGDGEESSDPVQTIRERYSKGENDEFLKPIIVGGKEARIKGEHPQFLQFSINNKGKTTTRFFSSTTVPTVFVRSLSFLGALIDLH
jgi:2,3-bisphosphoglycerate-independent phosphoglycerate mutase